MAESADARDNDDEASEEDESEALSDSNIEDDSDTSLLRDQGMYARPFFKSDLASDSNYDDWSSDKLINNKICDIERIPIMTPKW